MTTYKVIKERFESAELGSYISFGIAVLDGGDGTGRQTAYIPDIFTDEPSAKTLVRLCNELELDPEHLFDVVSDFIGL